MKPKLIVILGPTASGKTHLAVSLAEKIQGEIISVDSRQVYRGMDIGSGKDLKEYKDIPYHLIDIVEVGQEFSVSKFQALASDAISKILAQHHTPILCGGTGHYIKALIEDYPFDDIQTDLEQTRKWEKQSREELYTELKNADLWEERAWEEDSKRRMVRALEKKRSPYKKELVAGHFLDQYDVRLFYIQTEREVVRKKIWKRLQERFQEGMIDEVERLLHKGVSEERLMRFGLEYKWITRYLRDEVEYNVMVQKLYTDICRFSKRQMTFIRYLQKNGHTLTPIEDRDAFLHEISDWVVKD